jgi:DNA-binding LacI/PurR family transcriptional regulator
MSLRAIARELGVSSTAVSLALKNSPRISEDLRSKVVKLADKYGYVPNARLSELMSEVRNTTPGTYRATLGVISLFPEKDPAKVMPHLREVTKGARDRARKHGYRLESLWLKEPGMTPARLTDILHARGIHGILCLGSKNPDEHFPEELRAFAVVTFATSIPGKLHRVMSNFAADADMLMEQLTLRDYKQPGLVILNSGDRRSGYIYSSTFLGVQERTIEKPHVPILRMETWDERTFDKWFTKYEPDVLVMHQHPKFFLGLEKYLATRKKRIPQDLGMALADLNPDRSRYTGICQNLELMGATALDLLIGRVILNDFGEPEHPKVELVLGDWNEGKTLRPLKKPMN